MESWEVMRDAADRIGVKALAAKMNLSTALVYKWCQEPARTSEGSGARNPLDRVLAIYRLTADERLINWLCNHAGGFFVKNPTPPPVVDEALLSTTQRFVIAFSDLLTTVSRSIENDGQITADEAVRIRQTWETLKTKAEGFVVGCERGDYLHPKAAP